MNTKTCFFTFLLMGNIFITPTLLATEKKIQKQPKGELTVIINSAKNDQGHIELHLINSPAQFNNKAPSYAVCHKTINQLKAQCSFKELAYGYYAIFTFHDQNADQTLNYNLLGLPKEKLAISGIDLTDNDQPTFLQSKFEFNSPKAQLFINLQ
ncbi:MAG: DUF2141 domain-containing protein [Psychromonas sp.]|nr:DUF2141 domain-containing protein [Alteromonadales bacterium]MCP5077009.1 DUF2141 domain-containing protein [Psychromonas sp.]